MTVIPLLRRQRQEEHRFKASLEQPELYNKTPSQKKNHYINK
jgi:hypothetical protein